jgi:hypothetical protein
MVDEMDLLIGNGQRRKGGMPYTGVTAQVWQAVSNKALFGLLTAARLIWIFSLP